MSGTILEFSQPARRTIRHRLYETTEPWGCSWMYNGLVRHLSAPYRYRWDGASIARPGWSIIGLTPSDEMDGPSLGHDIPYRARGGLDIDKLQGCKIVNENGNRVIISRAEADWFIAAAMRYVGIPRAKCRIVHGIVRVAGWRHWGGPMPYGGE